MNEDRVGVSGREIMPEESDGMGIKGQWINKHTGQTIMVRNAIQDGNNMIIITDQGQRHVMKNLQAYFSSQNFG